MVLQHRSEGDGCAMFPVSSWAPDASVGAAVKYRRAATYLVCYSCSSAAPSVLLQPLLPVLENLPLPAAGLLLAGLHALLAAWHS